MAMKLTILSFQLTISNSLKKPLFETISSALVSRCFNCLFKYFARFSLSLSSVMLLASLAKKICPFNERSKFSRVLRMLAKKQLAF